MKKIYIIIVLITFTASSCKKSFLDLAPEDAYTDVNYYKTEAQFKSAIVAAYAPLRDVLLNDYFTSEMHSDNTVYQPIPSNRGTAYLERENISDFRNTSTNAYVAATWQHSYTGISRCNIVIERLKTASLPTAVTANIDGQAKFLRALNYFKLVRLFGGVPLFLKEVTKADDAFLPKSSEAEVYNQIIADAKDAITALSAPVFTGNKQTGEATKGAATMLLAEVYATQKKWKEAEDLLVTLAPMGYQLNLNYADAFTVANKNSRESLFEIQYLEGTATGTTPNIIPTHFLPRASTNTALITGIAVTNNGTGGWNTPSTDLINTFEAGDKRLDISIGIEEGAYNGSDLFVYSGAPKSIIGYVPAAGKIGVPYIKKYLLNTFTINTGSSVDFPIYRYSDALLLLAEAQNEQGKSPLTALNAVRVRAGLANTTSTDPILLRAVIAHERRVELAFENHRWHDLVRSGNAVAVINAFGVVARAQMPFLAPDAYVVDAHDLLFPLPQTDVGLNPALIQNPGY